MYTERTLRNKATGAGYRIHKGFSHLHNGSIYTICGERVTGYNMIDLSTGMLVWDCFDSNADHLWQLEDVENFLKEVYEEHGLKF